MLPHIQNSKAGKNRYDPVFKNLFEVYFSIPEALQAAYGGDVAELTQQVTKIGGLETLDRTPELVEQTFMGTTRSYIGSKYDKTSFDITLTLNLNLRNATDNYIYKIFQGWNTLAYNQQTGERTLDAVHRADFLRIVQYNRLGDIFRELTFKGVIFAGFDTTMSEMDYTSQDLMEISIKLRSDEATVVNA